MLGKIIPRGCMRTISKLSTFESGCSSQRHPNKGVGAWVLTVPQLETNTASSQLLPWRSQLPMTVRYNLPSSPYPDASTLLNGGRNSTSIMTPNGLATWSNVSAPAKEDSLIEDPTVTRETYRTFQRGTHRYRIINNRPKPQVTQRIRRIRRKAQKAWDLDTKSRETAIIQRREDNYQTEKKRIQRSDWWDWYVPYDNKPMQF